MMKKIVAIWKRLMKAMTTAYPKRAGFDSTPAKMKPKAATMNRTMPKTIKEMGRHCKKYLICK
jgi:hypothetical protein